MDSSLAKFRKLVDAYGNVSDLARRSGLSRRAIQYKCDGDRRVTQWDVWAVERALQLQARESEREPGDESMATDRRGTAGGEPSGRAIDSSEVGFR